MNGQQQEKLFVSVPACELCCAGWLYYRNTMHRVHIHCIDSTLIDSTLIVRYRVCCPIFTVLHDVHVSSAVLAGFTIETQCIACTHSLYIVIVIIASTLVVYTLIVRYRVCCL